ncbi:MAG TPA: GNAT family N-acetyltransferase [Candidatus Sulfomarinibacteraceae bacterium]|nr:GNAT family N-acetyltransferase [Candidatus Sulfomarinibacteraceae bacterium]
MAEVRILEIRDADGFALIPPCADPGFDHRSCDYWEDADRGSKAARLSWWDRSAAPVASPSKPAAANPFAPASSGPAFNPFAPSAARAKINPFGDDDDDAPADNPFAPRREARPAIGSDQPRKLQLLGRGLAVFGTYAKVLEVDGRAVAYVQFGPLSAYPRAQRLRELYPRLPSAPLPAAITCIATTPEARGAGHARRLVEAVCDDLAGRGFSAVEAYPERGARPDATSAATPEFWVSCGFAIAVDDERFPVLRREL